MSVSVTAGWNQSLHVSNTICLLENISIWIAQKRITNLGEKIINKEQSHNLVNNKKHNKVAIITITTQ